MAAACWRGPFRGRPAAPSRCWTIHRPAGDPRGAARSIEQLFNLFGLIGRSTPTGLQGVQAGQTPSADHQRVEREYGILLRRFVGALKALSQPLAASRHFVPHNNHGVAFERHPHDVHDSKQRVRPLAGGEPHHPEHDDDAHHGRRGRADAGIDEMHVVEHQAHTRKKRRLALSLQPADNRGAEAGSLLVRQPRPARRQRLERAAQESKVGGVGGAFPAIGQVALTAICSFTGSSPSWNACSRRAIAAQSMGFMRFWPLSARVAARAAPESAAISQSQSQCRANRRSPRSSSRQFPKHNGRPLIERQAVEACEAGPPAPSARGPDPASTRRPTGTPVRGHVLVERHLVGPVAPAPEPVAIARLVHGNAIDPGSQTGLTSKAVNGAEDAEEDFLGEVEGFVAVAKQVDRELHDHALVFGNQVGAGDLVAVRASLHERRLPTIDVQPADGARLLHFSSCTVHYNRGLKTRPA